MTRGAWAAAILAAWGVGMGWLLKRELFRPTSARLAEAARSIPPGALYYRLDMAGQQIGFASTTLDTLGDSIRVAELLTLEVPALGRLNRASARSTAVVGRTLQLRSLAVRFDDARLTFSAAGDVLADSVLRLRLVSARDSQWTRASLPRLSVLPALLPLRLAFGGELRPGTARTARVFDPLMLTERRVRVTVVSETTLVMPDSADFDSTAMAWVPVRFDTVPAFRFDLSDGGPPVSAWIDAQGRIVRATNPFGLTIERSAFEIAYENFRRRDTARLVQASRHPAAGELVPLTALEAGISADRGGPGELRLRLAGGGGRGWLEHLAGSPRVERRGDTAVFRPDGDDALQASYRLDAGPPDTALARWLAAEPLIQSENPRLRAQARLLVGRERDPTRAARRLLEWVHAEMERGVTDRLLTAVHVFEARRGDCNEHTVLFVALARAAGLPARPVSGLLYRDGRFYYHAWPEVYLGRWTAVDPMFGQFPASGARVPLVTGGLARPIELLPLVGKLKLEVL